ncbi:MAG: polymer-forming cytoskeletal protein [Spirochaetaceae bacterium]|jgi:cytoskeletal protein CcmA (bactofilin family)|nr:polymer-forming cytoskeletal protein [Spirochaetaceae bacterium]
MAYVNGGKIPRERKQTEFALNTIIGPGSFIQGDIETGGFTRIDGSLKGNLHAKGRVVVGEKARMRSSITGTNITIGGVVDGNILASERLIILPSAMIIGDITTRRIEANEGCLIHGKVRICQSEESWERARSQYRDKRHTVPRIDHG